MLGENNEVIKDSIVTLKYLTADEEMQMQMEGRERYRRDMEASRRLGQQENEKQLKEQQKRIDEQQEKINEQQETINKVTSENIEQAREIERLKQLLSQKKAT